MFAMGTKMKTEINNNQKQLGELMTDITKTEIDNMTDDEVLQHLRKYPYSTMWNNKDALIQAEYRLTYITGEQPEETIAEGTKIKIDPEKLNKWKDNTLKVESVKLIKGETAMTDKEFINKYAQNPNNVALDYDNAKRNGESVEPLMVVTVADLQSVINTVRKSCAEAYKQLAIKSGTGYEKGFAETILTAPIQEGL